MEINRQNLEREEGITLVLFVMTVTVLVMMVSLVVDLGKQELALTQLRQAADSAALSGARQLNGRPDGWRAAKLAAALIAKRYPIHGVNPNTQGNLVLASGDQSHWDQNPPAGTAEYSSANPPTIQRGVEGVIDGYHVKIERGLYRTSDDSAASPEGAGGVEFVNLENAAPGDVMSGDAYLFANAVRVEVSIDHLPGMFSRIFNTLGFSNLRAVSFSVMHGDIERRVAPIAISYDDLMLDTNPQTFSAQHQLPFLDPDYEYSRPIEVSFANKSGRSSVLDDGGELSDDAQKLIDEGMERFRSFAGYPNAQFLSTADAPAYPPDVCRGGTFTGISKNCKSIPIEAFFAYPGTNTITPELIVQALENGGVRARVGQTVAALRNLGDFATDESLSQRLANYINSSTLTFRDYFLNNGSTGLANYPRLRVQSDEVPVHVDQIISYPSDTPPLYGEQVQYQEFVMGNMSIQGPGRTTSGIGALNFINPLCHFPQIPLNNPDQNKVREVWAMVVAPRKSKTAAGTKIRYRDFPAMFSGGQQNSIAPVPSTQPTIIGFVRIGIYDGNFINLDLKFPVTGTPSNPDVTQRTSTPFYGVWGTSNFVIDDNPHSLDLTTSSFYKSMKSYEGSVKSSENCLDSSPVEDRDECALPEAMPQIDNLAMLFNCFNIRDKLGFDLDFLTGNLPPELTTPRVICSSDPDECGRSSYSSCPGCSTGGGCCDRVGYGNGKSKLLDLVIGILKKIGEPIPANPDTHCLYALRRDSDDRNDLGEYHPLGPLRAGHACAGLQAKLSYIRRRGRDHVSLTSGLPWSRQAPTLVEPPTV